MEMIIKKIRTGLLATVIVLSAFYSCDTTEKKQEKTINAIPSERFEEAGRADSLTNNDVNSDNDGNDGTMNGSMPESVTETGSGAKKDN